MIWVYNILLTLLSPIWVPWMLVRSRRRKEQVNWKERAGEVSIQLRPGSRRIWFHAVSVGEVIAAMPILQEVRSMAPDAEIILSVTTSSGHQTARTKAVGLFDHLVYFPIDVFRFTLGAMVRTKPHVVAVMETELWFNFLTSAKSMRATTIVVNGRISDRSFKRIRRLRFFYAAMLKELDHATMQSELDAERFRALGAASAEVLGNCKFDQALDGTDADPAEVRASLGLGTGDLVVVIGSTRGAMEEGFVLEAVSDPRLASVKFVHAPRHLERVPDIMAAYSKRFEVRQRSKGETGQYLLLDTYGELSRTYAAADIVVVGGGFDKLGGQNILQPLAHGKPVVHGPHMNNFRDAAEMAATAGATLVASSPAQLADILADLAQDRSKREQMGGRARELVAANVGASKRYAQKIVECLPKANEE